MEFRENFIQRFSEDVGKDAQATAVGHAHHDIFDIVFNRKLDDLVQHRNHRFQTFDGKAFLPDERPMQEMFERFHVD